MNIPIHVGLVFCFVTLGAEVCVVKVAFSSFSRKLKVLFLNFRSLVVFHVFSFFHGSDNRPAKLCIIQTISTMYCTAVANYQFIVELYIFEIKGTNFKST